MNKVPLIAGLSLLITCPLTNAATETGLQNKLSLETLRDADLGTAKGGTLDAAAVDIKPWIYWQSNDWRVYGMAEVFGATDTVEYESSAARPRSDGFVGLREAWVDYTGLTEYPGEYVRTGLQRVRATDGLWWDTDIEATRWVFNTTLVEAEIAAAQRFNLYRSDENDVLYEDKNRRHLFGKYRYQWLPGHWIGTRFHHLSDSKTPQANAPQDENPRQVFSNLEWIGVGIDSDYFRPSQQHRFNYSLNAVWMDGKRKSYNGSTLPEDVSGTFAEALARYRVGAWQLGGATAMSSGGIKADEDNRYMQTGLESNRSSFAGTRARFFRFGETYRASLGNLNVYTLFASFAPGKEMDLSFVAHSFERRNELADVQSGIAAPLIDGESALGQEFDVVYSHYLNNGVLSPEWTVEDSAYFRVRGGIFKAGDAYDNNTDNTVIHATGEFVWLF